MKSQVNSYKLSKLAAVPHRPPNYGPKIILRLDRAVGASQNSLNKFLNYF